MQQAVRLNFVRDLRRLILWGDGLGMVPFGFRIVVQFCVAEFCIGSCARLLGRIAGQQASDQAEDLVGKGIGGKPAPGKVFGAGEIALFFGEQGQQAECTRIDRIGRESFAVGLASLSSPAETRSSSFPRSSIRLSVGKIIGL